MKEEGESGGCDEQRTRQQQEDYSQWLQSKNVYCASKLVETTKQNVVAGWGCVATSDINEGTVLFSIPRDACFGASNRSGGDDEIVGSGSHHDCKTDEDDDEDPTTSDTQKDMALHLLRCQHSNNEWAPFLKMLTPHPLPWTWPNYLRRVLLKGTELEHVVENKVERIRAEYEEIIWQQKRVGDSNDELDISYQDYLNATAVVSSHANPWFGVSIVPFNTTLNCGINANVEFDLDEGSEGNERIVGRTICHVKKGQELFQRYGDSISELVYRCGFSPTNCSMEGDTVSIAMRDIITIAEDFLLSKRGFNDHSVKSETVPLSGGTDPSTTEIPQLSFKIQALKQSGAIDVSPWDGIDDLTAELTKPSESFLSQMIGRGGDIKDPSAYDDGGISKLIGIFIVLLSDDKAWNRASNELKSVGRNKCINPTADGYRVDEAALFKTDSEGCNDSDSEDSNTDDDDKSRTDDLTAAILLSSIANLSRRASMKMQQMSLDVGSGGNDPWRALILDLMISMDDDSVNSNERSVKRRKVQGSADAAAEMTAIPWKLISEAVQSAISHRLSRLLDGRKQCQNILDSLETKAGSNKASVDGISSKNLTDSECNSTPQIDLSDNDKLGAINTVRALHDVEKSILSQAKEILDMTISS